MSSDISNRMQGRNNMNVPIVSKPLLHLPLLQFINEHTQEKSPIIVLSVERLLEEWVVSRHTRGSILGKSRISAIHVGRPLIECQISRHTRRSILGKSCISAVHVGRPLVNR